ncbi:SAUR-like auxin-responsive protein family [Abeliophyllum distichum]|uniref:SAUR-like auxin-responsive protein family n=1 Tax=Abeliophyllum distichum TaxID=126358 RepID=A0ABD1P826_9LAMI
MGIRFLAIISQARKVLNPKSMQNQTTPFPGGCTRIDDVPKGHFAVYVGELNKHRFVVPISYLKHPLFQDLLKRSEEEYGFDYPASCLSIPCSENAFLDVTCRMKGLQLE